MPMLSFSYEGLGCIISSAHRGLLGSYPPLRRKMTQFITGPTVMTNVALTVLRFRIGDPFLSEQEARLSANDKLRHFTAE
jgi:hypothetical protein